MTQLFILLAQSATGAVITIIVLVLVAALIGYFTAWFYAKSIYTPVIKGLETDKENLNRQVEELTDDVRKLNGKIDRLNENVSKLEGKIEEKNKEISQLKIPK
jgi:peptidoglycan hydrolase CwlO-like protein